MSVDSGVGLNFSGGYRAAAPDFTSPGIKSNHFISPHNNSSVNSVSPPAVSSNRNVCVCGQFGVALLQKGKIKSASFVEVLSVRFLILGLIQSE